MEFDRQTEPAVAASEEGRGSFHDLALDREGPGLPPELGQLVGRQVRARAMVDLCLDDPAP